MKIKISERMAMTLVIGALSLAGISIAADGQRESQEDRKREQSEKQQQHKQEQKQEQAQRKSEQDQKQQQQRERTQRESDQDKKEQSARQQQQRERVERQSEQIQQQRVQQQKQQQRLSEQQQKQRINEQQQRVAQYRQHLDQQERLAQQQIQVLQQQKRTAQYRFQEQYVERLHQQQLSLRNDRFDYARDPYFYTPAIYRYKRGNTYYETNEYGARTLRQAVNYGYEEGFRAGKADRDDRWRSNYKDSYAYRDANYGYSGYSVNRTDYNYYFREGFRRGYEDSYNSRTQYGRVTDGNYSILDTILSQILGFQNLR